MQGTAAWGVLLGQLDPVLLHMIHRADMPAVAAEYPADRPRPWRHRRRHIEGQCIRGQPTGLLRLNVPRNAAELVIKPVMVRFLAEYPGVRLEVATDDAMMNIVAQGFDGGIRAGHQLAQDMVAMPAGPPRRFAVVGAPA